MKNEMSPPSAIPLTAPARRSAEVWANARADYLAGASAPEVCERYRLSLSTFRWRARTEAWRRSDCPDGTPFIDLDDETLREIDEGLPLNAADAGRLAWSNATRAVRSGRLLEARGWMRLHDQLCAFAKADSNLRRVHRRWAEDPQTADQVPTTTPFRPVEED